jgi:hypothetical protein
VGVSSPFYQAGMTEPKKPNNLKTALILVSVVLVFFAGFFIKRAWMG